MKAPELTQAQIAAYFRHVGLDLKPRKGEQRFACPLHGGERDSFSLRLDTGQWRCHSKCDRGGDVYEFEMLRSGLPFAEALAAVQLIVGADAEAGKPMASGGAAAPAGKKRSNGERAAVESRLVAEYSYQDETGKELFQAVRFEPGRKGQSKEFSQRHRGEGGGWVWNVKGVRLVPYHLPKLLRSSRESVVLVVEGEKCVEAAEYMGFVATCNPMGAGKWRAEYSEYLRGRRVVILPDNDDKGREHARRVFETLGPVAAEARVVALPGLAEKGDIADWIALGERRVELLELIAAAFATPVDGVEWRKDLLMRGDSPRGNLNNAIVALRACPAWRDVFGFDAFRQRFRRLKNGPHDVVKPWGTGALPRDWRDDDHAETTCWLQRNGIEASFETAARAVETVAMERQYNPVAEWLLGLKWDGEPRLNSWLFTYLGTVVECDGRGEKGETAAEREWREREESRSRQYLIAVGRKFLISMVARAVVPGCKVDHVLVLEGRQGMGKSTALKILASEEYFTDHLPDMENKDAQMALAGKWLVELGELESLRRAEVETFKRFVTQPVDHYRKPWGRAEIDVPRTCVFAGSTNRDEYLRDETGNRRIWAVQCTQIDLKKLAEDREQLFAEAVARYLDGEQWYLEDLVVIKAAEKAQMRRRPSDEWETAISEYLHYPSEPEKGVSPVDLARSVRIVDIAKDALKIPLERINEAVRKRIGAVLRERLGYVPKTLGRVRGYHLPDEFMEAWDWV